MNKNLLYKGLTIPPPPPEPEPEPDPTPVEDDYHISANITIGYAKYTSADNSETRDEYGYQSISSTLFSPSTFGSCSNSKIAHLYTHLNSNQGNNGTTFNLSNPDPNKYSAKTAKIIRLDSGLECLCKFIEVAGKEGQDPTYSFDWDYDTFLFTSSDLNKTISIYIEIV